MNVDRQLVAELKAEALLRITIIDEMINDQLNEILHHPDFKELEAAWRGLHYLVNQSRSKNTEYPLKIVIRILDLRKDDLIKDFELSPIFDKSQYPDRVINLENCELFKKVYTEIFSTSDVSPFGMLIGAYEFSHHPQDMTLLERISQIAAKIHAPFISAVSPRMFQADHFNEVCMLQGVSNAFGRMEYADWHTFRVSGESKYIGLCLPHILLRDPHIFNRDFNFRESAEPKDLLWGNAAFAYGACVARAYHEKNWLGTMRGPDQDGLVEGLYFQTFYSKDGTSDYEFSLDAMIGAEKETELTNLGFIPLIENPTMSNPAFFRSPSAHKPKVCDYEQSNENVRIWSQLESVFAGSLFARYLMAMAQAYNLSVKENYRYLFQRWIKEYYRYEEEAEDCFMAAHPLKEMNIYSVSEIADKPGHYQVVMFIRPTYKLEPMTIAMRIEVDLPNPDLIFDSKCGTEMVERLLKMIQAYQARVEDALTLFEKYKDINLRDSAGHNLPQRGFLDPEQRFAYFFHGIGCEVIFPDGIVDWDFFYNRQNICFEINHLSYFAKKGTDAFPEFKDEKVLNKVFKEAENQGLIQLQFDCFGGNSGYLLKFSAEIL